MWAGKSKLRSVVSIIGKRGCVVGVSLLSESLTPHILEASRGIYTEAFGWFCVSTTFGGHGLLFPLLSRPPCCPVCSSSWWIMWHSWGKSPGPVLFIYWRVSTHMICMHAPHPSIHLIQPSVCMRLYNKVWCNVYIRLHHVLWFYCVAVSRRLVYVSTVDGALTVIDEQGLTRWQYLTGGPLFFSSLGHDKVRLGSININWGERKERAPH